MKDLDMEDIPRLTLYNKADLVEDFTPTQTPYALISAKAKDSREQLQALLLDKIKDIFEPFTLRVPFSKSYKIHDLESVAILEDVTTKMTVRSSKATLLRKTNGD